MRFEFITLGIAQDGGFPQIGCKLDCCKNVPIHKNFISSSAIIDNKSKEFWLIDVTPEFRYQIKLIETKVKSIIPKGIFITHAHSGHYTGLNEFGKEVINSNELPIYVMPKMKKFLENNKPWKNLVNQRNISLNELCNDNQIDLHRDLYIQPFKVNHRNEISETVGFKIKGINNSIIYLPDIDNLELLNIKKLIKENDYIFLDGTFYSKDEIKFRDVNKIPHPFIEDTMETLKDLPPKEKSKIYFTHLNHTNDALRKNSKTYNSIESLGFKFAKEKFSITI